jgi:arabinofuranan 3-O-arabinosyltransferase
LATTEQPSILLGRGGAVTAAASARRRRATTLATYLVLAAIAWVPLFLTHPGMVVADTKQYLYLDPGRLMQQAASLWDPNLGMGTVTHQYIGYLLPMGPFYYVLAHIGLPAWAAQRIWLGGLLFAAGTGALFLARVLRLEGPGRPVAAAAYMLSPYLLQDFSRLSALLMPWSGLPWMVGLMILAVRRGGWRYPAAFAIVTALVGGVNATTLLYAGLAPVIWLPYAVWISRETTWRRALSVFWKTGLLSLLVSLWWISGLAVEGAFNIPVLRYTETVETVSKTSLASEILRGLGYWYFYGEDKLGPWIQPATEYTQRVWLLGVSYLVPTLAFASAFVVRWRYRFYFAILIFVGTVIAVGAYPFADPSPFGSLLKYAGDNSTVGLALRSTNRAVPLVVLGTSFLLGAAVTAVARRARVTGALAGAVVGALVLLNIYPLWNGTAIGGPNLERPSQLPSYWTSAAKYLDSQGKGAAGYSTRVLGIPGSDFASYRWGNTIDTIEQGIMKRPYVARELFPDGTAGTVNLVNALDSTVQEGVAVPGSIAPIARLESAGDVLLDNDLQYERYNTPRPKQNWDLLTPPPRGLGNPVTFGTPRPSNSVEFPMIDEITLSEAGQPDPAPLAVFPVSGARPIVRTDPADRPLLVDGDGSGLVYAADTGLLDTNAAVIYTPSLATKPAEMRRELASGADLVLTDTNRKQAIRWGTIRENYGYTEGAKESPEPDPLDQRLDLFPGAGTSTQTVAEQLGVRSVTASSYGNPVTYTPEDRPSNAFDGNLLTNWTTGDFSDPVGQWLRIDLQHPTTTDHVTLVQPINGAHNRFIRTATLTFDGRSKMKVDLGPQSRTKSGQEVRFPQRTFQTLTITIDSTTSGPRNSYQGLSGVGFAEVEIPHQQLTETIRMPEDMLRAAGASSISHQLDVLMTRQRAAPTPPRLDPEPSMSRTFWLPTARTFALTGTARVSAVAPDNSIDQLLGQPGSGGSGVVATSSSRMTGNVQMRASATIDGNPATFWSPTFGTQVGQWLDYSLPAPVTFDHLDLQVVADGHHSVPTQITISTESGSRTVELPPVADRSRPDATAAAPVSFAPLTGSNIRVTISAVRPVETLDYYSEGPIELPVGIAEIGIPGVSAAPPPAQLPGTCRSDLVSIDGKPVSVRVTGTTASAEALDGLSLAGCGPDANGVTLGPGNHVVTTASTYTADLDVDQLSLASAPGGGALFPNATEQVPATSPGPSPRVKVLNQNSTSVHLQLRNPGHPFWLVLGQSQDKGWQATLAGRSLGPSQLVDGYANGWYVDPSGMPATLDATFHFAPQNLVWGALIASAATLAFCVALVLWPGRRWLEQRRRVRRGRGRRPGRRGRASLLAGGDLLAGGGGDGAGGGDGPPDDGPGGHGAAASVGPVLVSPFSAAGGRPRLLAVIAATAGCGLLAAAVFRPLAGILIGAAVAAVLLVRRARVLLAVPAVGLMVATGLYFVIEQHRHAYPPEFEWPTFFSLGSVLAWLALLLLLADVVVEAVRRQRSRGAAGHGRPPPPGPPGSSAP